MIQEIVFIAFAILTIAGALGAVLLKNVFYNALCLILSLFGVAALFVFLHAEFLAVVEVIVYIGAISIAIIFAVMLSNTMIQKSPPRDTKKMFKSWLLALTVFVVLHRVIIATDWPVTTLEGDYSIKALGRLLLTEQVIAFEIISVILLVAIIGALALTSRENT